MVDKCVLCSLVNQPIKDIRYDALVDAYMKITSLFQLKTQAEVYRQEDSVTKSSKLHEAAIPEKKTTSKHTVQQQKRSSDIRIKAEPVDEDFPASLSSFIEEHKRRTENSPSFNCNGSPGISVDKNDESMEADQVVKVEPTQLPQSDLPPYNEANKTTPDEMAPDDIISTDEHRSPKAGSSKESNIIHFDINQMMEGQQQQQDGFGFDKPTTTAATDHGNATSSSAYPPPLSSNSEYSLNNSPTFFADPTYLPFGGDPQGGQNFPASYNASSLNDLTCPICFKTFSYDDTLRHHMQKIHSDKSYACEICGKEFKIHSYLKSHMLYHKAPEYKCGVCGKEFYVKSAFKKHKAIHDGKDFSCEFCYKKFARASTLKAHKRTCKFIS